jgi:molybdopterin synthase sulfur carrier subunit
MAKIRVFYFAGLRDLVERGEESLELPGSVVNVGQLARHLERVHPELAGKLQGVRLAVNESFASFEDSISDGDVVALIPPVAGG